MRKFLALYLLASILLSACEPTHTPPPVTEVAKYKVWDFGDAPDPEFETVLASDGLRTRDPSQFWLGSLEPPGATLEGDAKITDRDEQDDGLIELMERSGRVSLTFQAAMSEQAQARVVYFNLWADTDNNGRWQDALGQRGSGEWIVVNREISLAPGETAQTAAEFEQVGGAREHWIRAALTDAPISASEPYVRGEYQLGEVEDFDLLPPYKPPSTPTPVWDFGDAPDPRFPSLLASDGLRTRDPSQFWLGSLEAPGATLERDANITNLDQQDDGLIELILRQSGVVSLTFQAAMSEQAQARVVYFNLWADTNNNGRWQGPALLDAPTSEWIVGNREIRLAPGETAQVEAEFGRVRGALRHWFRAALTDTPVPGFAFWGPFGTGEHQLGEVEDYEYLRPPDTPTPPPPPPTLPPEVLDFGDAPDPRFPTLLASNGLRTIDPSQFWLGSLGVPGATLERDANITDLDQQDDGLIEMRDRGGLVSLTFQAAMSEPAQARFVWFSLWADLNNDGSWEDIILSRQICVPTPNPRSDFDQVGPQFCNIREWIVFNQGIWLRPGTTAQFEADIPHFWGNFEHWIRAAITDGPMLGFTGQHQMGEVEDYHLLPPYVLPNRQNPTSTPSVPPTHVAPTPAITKGAYIITDDGFRVAYTGRREVPPGGILAAPFQVWTPDGLPAKGALTVTLRASASDPDAVHATAELNAQGKVTILLNIGDYPEGTILELLITHLGKAYKVVTGITVTP